ncbi:sugar ABC transporter substrate-binding protein [Halosolutus halophilus]|uniref:sugar ABC transporter substrate-binding protein n=1 Tax=Halosolutus halophilus TaxID=1552990 RepID=UPI0022351767|nr:substrate-binding domain-containing protein [Halosolutus halophilus]
MTYPDRRQFLKRASATAVVGMVAGCTGAGGGDSEFNQIGLSAYVRGGSWITAYIEAAEFYAEQIGVDLDVRPNEQSAQQQVSDIRDMANQGYDGIIVGVWDTGAAEGAINNAIDDGIPVIATNADTSSSEIPLYVGFSNYAGGEACAQEMIASLEEQRGDQDEWTVLDVRGPQGNQSANQRSQGFLDVMEEDDRVVVSDVLNGKFARDTAQEVTQEWINANDEVDGIYSGNLSMGLGVVRALENLGLDAPKGEDDHIILTQMDGSGEVNELIGDGVIDAAADQPNYFYNPIAIEYLRMYHEDGSDAIPEVGSTVESGDLDIQTGDYKDVELWSEDIWAPAEIDEQNGHPWFKTNNIIITEENADQPYLWGNVWG